MWFNQKGSQSRCWVFVGRDFKDSSACKCPASVRQSVTPANFCQCLLSKDRLTIISACRDSERKYSSVLWLSLTS